MLFYCKEDFYARSAKSRKLSRKSEKECALMMKQGDATAREKIIISYLPAVAAYVRKMPARMQTYALICRFVAALEKAVDTFDFLQDNCYIDSIISEQVCAISFFKNGTCHSLDKHIVLESCNLFHNSLSNILKVVSSKN